jgi:uncharacterized protein (TIGR02145 family)
VGNTPPVAVIRLGQGQEEFNIFRFGATESHDEETPITELLVRWDWNNDGSWDTGYSTNKIENHQYLQSGTYTAKLEVKDSGGLMDTSTVTFTVHYNIGILTDSRDDHKYYYCEIGSQTWMIENLAFLPSVSPPETGSSIDPRYYVFGYYGTSVNEAKPMINSWGVMYNLPGALIACPPGWHLPIDEEWKILEKFLGMNPSQADSTGWRNSGTVGKKLKSPSAWYPDNTGDNSSGFNAGPNAYRYGNGRFGASNPSNTFFWSPSVLNEQFALYRGLDGLFDGVKRWGFDTSLGLSVRCLRDE